MFGEPEYILPDELTSIEEYAFENTPVSVVRIPDSCARINSYAFNQCDSLTQIWIPSECEVCDDAFAECGPVYVFGYRESSAEMYCSKHNNCVFVEIHMGE